MPINHEKAREYIQAHGTILERARLHALLDGASAEDVPPELATLQNPDGGFPYGLRMGEPSTLNHTALALQWLADLQQNDSPTASGARAFLRSRQTTGGIWREQRNLTYPDLPLWMDAESAAADIYTTALCAATLLPDEDALLVVDRAVAWLQTQQGRDGLLHGFRLPASILIAPAFREMLGEESRHTRRLIAGLGQAFSDEWPASLVADLLIRLLDAGYTGHTEVVARAWERLQTLQEADGSFASEDGPEGAVAATIMALVVARRLGRRR